MLESVIAAAIAAAITAEEAGFDDVWIAEHHFMSYGICPSAITLAGYLLGATRRITVCCPPSTRLQATTASP